MKKIILVTALSLGLIACGEEEATVTTPDSVKKANQGLTFAYPARGQAEVAVSSPVVLRFSSAIIAEDPAAAIELVDSEGTSVPFTAKVVEVDGRSLMLTPETSLKPLETYTVRFVEGLRLANGTTNGPSNPIEFSTRGLFEGPKSVVAVSDTFEVERMIPDTAATVSGVQLQIMDFSTFRLQFSQPIDQSTVNYGLAGTPSVSLVSRGEAVEASVIASGRYLTIDPTEDLTPGQTYTLSVNNNLKSTYGASLASFEREFQPKDSGNTSSLSQYAFDSDNGTILSKLSGNPINAVPLSSTLLGDDNETQQSGALAAELAYIPNYPEVIPLRIAKNSQLLGEPLQILIGGAVDAGFNSGEVDIRFISDATGYLIPNPYSTRADAPRHIVLFLDVALTTGDSRASGAITQDILHIQVTGEAEVIDGSLVVSALGVVEPDILGLERATSLLSFFLGSEGEGEEKIYEIPADTTAPSLASWSPGNNNGGLLKQNDPIILNFDEPLDPSSIEANSTLFVSSGNTPVGFTPRMDGASLVITPTAEWSYGETISIEYINVTDLAGNGVTGQVSVTTPQSVDLSTGLDNSFYGQLSRDLATLGEPLPTADNRQSPFILSVYPGFPCTTTGGNISSGDAGRCAGGESSDDNMPVTSLPANRSIRIVFSRDMDPSTITESTFAVFNSTAGVAVTGERRLEGNLLTFTPDEPWTPGSLYSYILTTTTNASTPCTGNGICDLNGLPLQTNPLVTETGAGVPIPPYGGAGGSMVVVFTGAEETSSVLEPLVALPSPDVNANLIRDPGELPPSTDTALPKNIARLSLDPDANPDNDGTIATGAAVADGNVGCGFEEIGFKSFSTVEVNGTTYNKGTDTPPFPYGYFNNADNPGTQPIFGDRLTCTDQSDSLLAVTASLNAEVAGRVDASEVESIDPDAPDLVKANGGVLALIHPGMVFLSGLNVYTRYTDAVVSLNFEDTPNYTGPQVMRMRYNCDPQDSARPCDGPYGGMIPGWIYEDESGQTVFAATIDAYIDGPRLSPITINNNSEPGTADYQVPVKTTLNSVETTINLTGKLEFLDNGRLSIEQTNVEAIKVPLGIDVQNGLLKSDMFLQIKAGETRINLVSPPIKN